MDKPSLPVVELLDEATLEMLRKKTPAERLSMAFAANRTLRHLMSGGISWQHPEWTEEQVRQEVVRRLIHGAACATNNVISLSD